MQIYTKIVIMTLYVIHKAEIMSRKRDDFDRIKTAQECFLQRPGHLLRRQDLFYENQKAAQAIVVYKIEGCPELLTVPYARPVGEIYVKKCSN